MTVFPRFLAALFFSAITGLAAELRVSAAASLDDAMTEISALHLKSHGEAVKLNFGGSNSLARQIRAGAPCDVFFSADQAMLEDLREDDLLHENSITPLLTNSLVVIVPTGSSFKINSARDLASSAIRRIALGDPAAVPAGVYAKTWLESQNVWKEVSGKIVGTENVRAALAAVESGNVDAGIVYRTDALISKKTTVAFEVGGPDAPRIVYPAAATKSSPDPGKAIRFIRFMQTEPAMEIFRKHGFILPPAEPRK